MVDGTLRGWRGVLVRAHLRRCEECQRELERQRAVAAGLRALEAAAGDETEPPEGLLETLLEQAGHFGVLRRLAVGAGPAAPPRRPPGLIATGTVTTTAPGGRGAVA